MIGFVRGPEPQALADVRARALPILQGIASGGTPPTSEQIKGYGPPEVRRALWEAQHRKCCYCEKEIEDTREDVDHHRPKAQADRRPGSLLDHGYWWLAFSWDNLLYACPQCNQKPNKGIRFPLKLGSVPLAVHEQPPGREHPLLIDPARESGVPHIQFVREKRGASFVWIPTPRNNSPEGESTIEVCGLARDPLLVRYKEHVKDHVMPVVDAVRDAMRAREERHRLVYEEVERGKRKLLNRRQCFVGLSYDALELFVSSASLASFRQSWPMP